MLANNLNVAWLLAVGAAVAGIRVLLMRQADDYPALTVDGFVNGLGIGIGAFQFGLFLNPVLAMEIAATRQPLEQIPGLRAQVLEKFMVKRLGQPEDIGWLAVYLGSDESGWVTAADFAIDAGATAW